MGSRADFWCSSCRISSRLASLRARVRSGLSSDRYQRRKTGQARAQYDALFLAAAVLQADIDIHVTRIPPPQMRPERRQRLQHVRTLLHYETRAHADRLLTKDASLFVVNLLIVASFRGLNRKRVDSGGHPY